jgi:hypothetical protein
VAQVHPADLAHEGRVKLSDLDRHRPLPCELGAG